MFNIGDRVRILPTILSDYGDFPYVGEVGTVCDIICNNSQFGVEFPTPNLYLHDCSGTARQNSGWWCVANYLELVSEDEASDIWSYIKGGVIDE